MVAVRALIRFAVAIFPSFALPCSMPGIASCEPSATVDLSRVSFSVLEKAVTEYEEFATQLLKTALANKSEIGGKRMNVVASDEVVVSTCPDRATTYTSLLQVKDFAQHNQWKVCPAHLSAIKFDVIALVDKGIVSRDLQPLVKDKVDRQLQVKAIVVLQALSEFTKRQGIQNAK